MKPSSRELHRRGSPDLPRRREALISRAILVREAGRVGFDNPYFRAWAVRELVR